MGPCFIFQRAYLKVTTAEDGVLSDIGLQQAADLFAYGAQRVGVNGKTPCEAQTYRDGKQEIKALIEYAIRLRTTSDDYAVKEISTETLLGAVRAWLDEYALAKYCPAC